MWDTGANFTAISSKIAEELGLACLGKSGVSGILAKQTICNVYILNIYLPNNDKYKIKVMGAQPKNSDILIGMDIISKGNFAISCYDNKTTFTFCYPSFGKIDFNNSWENI
jgi:propanediol dehydratase large subunit